MVLYIDFTIYQDFNKDNQFIYLFIYLKDAEKI